ncbi:hypothetical protein QOT17_009488 [Balamuthia mandrillaris]
MGWEWRIFYEGDVTKDFAALLEGKGRPRSSFFSKDLPGAVEQRTDVYFASQSDDLGIKSRGGSSSFFSFSSSSLEVKRCKQRRTTDGIERWEKSHLRCGSHKASKKQMEEIGEGVGVVVVGKLPLKKSRWTFYVPVKLRVEKKGKKGGEEGEGRKVMVSGECTLVEVEQLEGAVYTSVALEEFQFPDAIVAAVEELGLPSFSPAKALLPPHQKQTLVNTSEDEAPAGDEEAKGSKDDGGDGDGAAVSVWMTKYGQGYPAFVNGLYHPLRHNSSSS